MVHMNKSEKSHYRDELLSKIIEICSQNDYQHITNFALVILENAHVFIHGSNSTTVPEVLYAAAWICGEFCS
ncbi:unnamed protein product [Rotaria sordida]|nr:unnamed protein product [Rotaria sordida]